MTFHIAIQYHICCKATTQPFNIVQPLSLVALCNRPALASLSTSPIALYSYSIGGNILMQEKKNLQGLVPKNGTRCLGKKIP